MAEWGVIGFVHFYLHNNGGAIPDTQSNKVGCRDNTRQHRKLHGCHHFELTINISSTSRSPEATPKTFLNTLKKGEFNYESNCCINSRKRPSSKRTALDPRSRGSTKPRKRCTYLLNPGYGVNFIRDQRPSRQGEIIST